MRRIILIAACILLAVSTGLSQQKRGKAKPKPIPTFEEYLNSTPADEVLFTKLDYSLLDGLVGWRLATRGNLDKATGEQSLIYYDTDRITRLSSGVKRVWLKYVTEKYDNQDSYLLALEEYDCAEVRYRTLESASYDKNGKNLNSVPGTKVWAFVIPDSVGEEVFGVICLNHKGQDYQDMKFAAELFQIARQKEKKRDFRSAAVWYRLALKRAPDNPKINEALLRLAEVTPKILPNEPLPPS